MTPSTLADGTSVLLVQRTFSAGFRPDLTGNVQACVGFNGTDFKAVDCAATNVEFVSLSGNKLVATGGACQSGHNNAAEITVDATGKKCATFTTTTVKATTS
jgi:hypothetical protein